MGTANLELELTTATGEDLNDFVRIELFSASTSDHFQNNVQARRKIAVNGVRADAANIYRVLITPNNYRTVQFFVMLTDGQTRSQTVACPVDPARVVSLRTPPFAGLTADLQRILSASEISRFTTPAGAFLQGRALFDALSGNPKLQACLLNIAVKSGATPLRDGKSCLEHYNGMVRIEQDRLFVQTHAALREEVQNSPLFHPVAATLHDPLPGYAITDSFKTFDQHGNLQVTFQRRGTVGDDYVADVDIDDAQGIE